ncbi:siderophore-interacting protein [Ensifer sp. NPDC090286]|uniref:siderophore-interacting protein n=1 Tax=Ensifer sp. NPDC090286 TaxID=3363991 RepID=UPI003839DE7D
MTHDYLTARVKHREAVTASMIRIVLEGGDLHRFASTGRPDEFVWLSFPTDDDEEGTGRYYTVRRWDSARAEMTIDFVKHEIGIATNWAQQAREGDAIRLLAPRFRFNPPSDAGYIALIADMTGLPAVGRILEELPDKISVIAHVEIPHENERQIIETACHVTLQWHETAGCGNQRTRLFDIARAVRFPDGPGYVWIAGEAKAVSQSRKYLRDVMGFDKDHITSVGYWVHGQARS